MLIMLAGTFFSAISQVLLKQSANITYKNPLREYLNWRVILAYGIFFGVLLLNTWCYTRVDMKFGPVIDTAAYVFVLIFSWRIPKVEQKRPDQVGRDAENAEIPAAQRAPDILSGYKHQRNAEQPQPHQQHTAGKVRGLGAALGAAGCLTAAGR